MHIYRVLLTVPAQRDMDDIPARDFEKVRERILSLAKNVRPSGVIKLKGPLHRVRVGDWRILYDIYDAKTEAHILRVLRRSERTYKHV